MAISRKRGAYTGLFVGRQRRSERKCTIAAASFHLVREAPVSAPAELEMRPRGGVVTQRSAKPFTPVQFRAWPPFIFNGLVVFFESGTLRSNTFSDPLVTHP